MVPTEELEGYARKSRILKLLAILTACAIVLVLISLPGQKQEVPEFNLPLLSGGESLSREDLEGSPVVMNFFASWCGPCREEARRLENAWKAYENDGVRFVGVNIKDTTEKASRFVNEFGITFPVVVDAEEKLAGPLGVDAGLPQTFFISSDGTLQSNAAGDEVGGGGGTVQLGAISSEQLESHVEALLAEDQ
ncbi:MAG: TlpA family protein disulfide reductase [Actinobacteria bacterium]|nr:TlpA family protein disulfide reductase [Actinomycetota bacterium]